jgi:hypothetical protein
MDSLATTAAGAHSLNSVGSQTTWIVCGISDLIPRQRTSIKDLAMLDRSKQVIERAVQKNIDCERNQTLEGTTMT